MSGALASAGLWRAGEGAFESVVPLSLSGAAWYGLWWALSQPSGGRPFSEVERFALFGAAAALSAWSTSRQAWLLGTRRPRAAVGWSLLTGALVLAVLLPLARGSFGSTCTGDLGGQLISAAGPDGQLVAACQVGGVPGSPYNRGALILASWSGTLDAGSAASALIMTVLASVALRDRRILPTTIPRKLGDHLRLAPAMGTASAIGKVGPEGRIVACGNPTLWGEPCGQIYPAEAPPEPGAWCLRCQQGFTAASTELELTIISLFSADLDVLNGLERLDTVSWDQGERQPADPRLSGQERWVVLGRIRVPDVLSVASVLALVHEQLPRWAEADPTTAEASRLARERMSRVAAWLLTGRLQHRLTYARPTRRARYGVGTTRLRDLVSDAGEALTLQLDLGLLPVEMRVGFRQTFIDTSRLTVQQNSRVDVWVPVGPQRDDGRWVARVEGEALRAWLATDRVRPQAARGVPEPVAYRPFGADAPASGGGLLDLVRRPLPEDEGEPLDTPSGGASIAEWDWLEWEQIELLRRECLVLVQREAAP